MAAQPRMGLLPQWRRRHGFVGRPHTRLDGAGLTRLGKRAVAGPTVQATALPLRGPIKSHKIRPTTGRTAINKIHTALFAGDAELCNTFTIAQISRPNTIRAISPLTPFIGSIFLLHFAEDGEYPSGAPRRPTGSQRGQR